MTRPIKWVGSSREDLSSFPADARIRIGFDLYRVQNGGEPGDFKSMKSVGPGAYEIRVRTSRAWRVIYVAKFAGAVYVLHAFEKRTQKTAQSDIELARHRYQQIPEMK